jgi:hypothetical protein
MISHANQDNIMALVKEMKDTYGENLAEKARTVHDY